MRATIRRGVILGPLLLGFGCERSAEHPHPHPHPHTEESNPESDHDIPPVTLTRHSERHQLFLEHPRLVVGRSSEFFAHLTELDSGAPVATGGVTLEATSPSGEVVRLVAKEPRRAGLFVLEGAFSEFGRYRAQLSRASEAGEDRIDLGPMYIYTSEAEARVSAQLEPSAPPVGSVTFTLEQQWAIGLRLASVERRTLVERLRIPARVEPRHHDAAHVTPPVAGRLVPRNGEHLPELGDRVERDQILGYVEPPMPVTQAAALSATRLEARIRTLDLDIKQAELENQLHRAETRLEYAMRNFERTRSLHERGVATTQELEDSEREHNLVKAEVKAAQRLLEAYAQTETALQKISSPALETDGLNRIPLIAPIEGVIEEVAHVQGEHIGTDHAVFQIVDRASVWIEGRVSEFDLPNLSKEPSALLTIPGTDAQARNIEQDLGGRLVRVGAVVDPIRRTVPIRYEVPNHNEWLRLGMSVSLDVETARRTDSISVPTRSVLEENAQPFVFVQTDGETFSRRPVRLGVRDGDWVEVIHGLSGAERVVSFGAYDLRLAELTPDDTAHDHGHSH